ncbi:DUF6310 domain-containing protein [Myxococcus faecalis]|uniref:DUF6310 domain-containing protein n=1 Tax=Myxococcus faecalis TaxID=3115646 RepID=UPI003CFA215B
MTSHPGRVERRGRTARGFCAQTTQIGAPRRHARIADAPPPARIRPFNTYTDFLQEQVERDQVEEFLVDRRIAQACGYRFTVGVSEVEHKQALLELEPSLAPNIVVTGCKR